MDRAVIDRLVRAAGALSDETFTFVGETVSIKFQSHAEAFAVCHQFRSALRAAERELAKEEKEVMDLTKITTPYGLLDEATQRALKEHGGPYEVYYGVAEARWNLTQPAWTADTVYRVRPESPKPREWYLIDGKALSVGCFETPPSNAIHVREVIE